MRAQLVQILLSSARPKSSAISCATPPAVAAAVGRISSSAVRFASLALAVGTKSSVTSGRVGFQASFDIALMNADAAFVPSWIQISVPILECQFYFFLLKKAFWEGFFFSSNFLFYKTKFKPVFPTGL
jgi:hypothetical protein